MDTVARTVAFRARYSDDKVELPLDQPWDGRRCPASRRSSLVPDAHGGNMDTPSAGRRPCFLGVNVEGAMFALGDGHCRQGGGGPAVAVGGDGPTVILELVQGVPTVARLSPTTT
jgi:acetamidase/formamidase